MVGDLWPVACYEMQPVCGRHASYARHFNGSRVAATLIGLQITLSA